MQEAQEPCKDFKDMINFNASLIVWRWWQRPRQSKYISFIM